MKFIPSLRSLKHLLIVALLLGTVTGLVFFAMVDFRVAKRLRTRASGASPVILSAPLVLEAGQLMSPLSLRRELLHRRFSETEAPPKSPGEFRIHKDWLELYNRPFRNAHNEPVTAESFRYNFLTGAIIGSDDSPRRSLPLSPKVLSHLSGGNLRVTQHKKLSQIPKTLQQAVLGIEDQRFYSHIGVDVISIARAVVSNLKAGKIVQGGSTITQQLAKNLLFTPRKTLSRKIVEAFASLSLELRLSKDEILELYLNEVYFGQEGSVAIHGVESASYMFFGKSVERLTLEESALLAGIIQAPSYYSPRRHQDRATKRRNIVLRKMYQQGMIKQVDYDRSKEIALDIVKTPHFKRSAPYFLEAVRRSVGDSLELSAAVVAKAAVHTGLIPGMQSCAEKALQEGLAELEQKRPALAKHKPPLEAGLVAIEPFSGLIRSWVGGRRYTSNQFDHVDQLRRQIGSTMKPFLYLTALDANLNDYRPATPRSILPDKPLSVQLTDGTTWSPQNFDHKFRGQVTLRYALEKSLNLPAAYLGQRVGIHHLVNTASRFRISKNLPAVPSLALGATDTSLLDLTAAYAALANGGLYITPRSFISVIDASGEQMASNPFTEEVVADDAAVYVLTDVLQGVLNRGTAATVRRRGYKRAAAGKTGTSSETRDAWFVGFTPTLAAGVWVGFDNNDPIGLTGGGAAAPIWTKFMQCAEPFHRDGQFIPPASVVSLKLDPESGRLWTPDCHATTPVQEVFVRGTEPTESCSGAVERSRPVPSRQPMPKKRKGFWQRLFG